MVGNAMLTQPDEHLEGWEIQGGRDMSKGFYDQLAAVPAEESANDM
jgi:hypothetical protein